MVSMGGGGESQGPISLNETLATTVFRILHCYSINSMFSFLFLFSCSLCSYSRFLYSPQYTLCSLCLCPFSCSLCSYTSVFYTLHCILCSLLFVQSPAICIQVFTFSIFSTVFYVLLFVDILPFSIFSTVYSMFSSSLSILLLSVQLLSFSMFSTVFYVLSFLSSLLHSVQLLCFLYFPLYSMFSSSLSILLLSVQLLPFSVFSTVLYMFSFFVYSPAVATPRAGKQTCKDEENKEYSGEYRKREQLHAQGAGEWTQSSYEKIEYNSGQYREREKLHMQRAGELIKKRTYYIEYSGEYKKKQVLESLCSQSHFQYSPLYSICSLIYFVYSPALCAATRLFSVFSTVLFVLFFEFIVYILLPQLHREQENRQRRREHRVQWRIKKNGDRRLFHSYSHFLYSPLYSMFSSSLSILLLQLHREQENRQKREHIYRVQWRIQKK